MTAGAPPCASCGAPRWFEFQILPHLVTEIERATELEQSGVGSDGSHVGAGVEESLNVDVLGGGPDALDWGTVAVYTCSRSCAAKVEQSGSAYVEEHCWHQAI
jgi:hypothetical protein